MNVLINAVKGLAATLNCVAAWRGTYSRLSGGSLQIGATVIERDYDVFDHDGVVTIVRSTDWLFRACDFGDLYPPKPGDLWKVENWNNAGIPKEDKDGWFAVMEIGKKPCYQPHDDQGVMLTVHTKRVPSGG